MPRFLATLAFDGGLYHGWQIQPNRPTVQEELEKVLALLNKEAVRVYGAGRTDSGVHGWGQHAAFNMNEDWTSRQLTLALNAHLPQGITVRHLRPCPEGFDPRTAAKWRTYRYFIWQDSTCPTYLRPYVWWRKGKSWQQELAFWGWKAYQGRHDFLAFCKSGEAPENTLRTLFSLQCRKKGSLWVFSVRGQSFLMNMVRAMIGTLDSLCRGHITKEEFLALLEGAERKDGGPTAPPSGLFFWRVGYHRRSGLE